MNRIPSSGPGLRLAEWSSLVVLFAVLAGFRVGPVMATGLRTAVPVRIYEWKGPHGVMHFSGTPPPRNQPGVTQLRQKTLELIPVSAREARRDYRSSLRAARSMEQGLRMLEKEEGVTSGAVPPPVYSGNGSGGMVPSGQIGQQSEFYPPLGFYPVGLEPPRVDLSPQPAPDLSPPSAGFGICGYEITCPGTLTPPVIGSGPTFAPQPVPPPTPVPPTAPPPPPPPFHH